MLTADTCRTVLFLLEIVYIWRLFSSNASYVNAGIGVGSYFILSNLLQLAFVMFFARSQFVFAELMLILNFFNLTFLYFNHNNHPWFIHVPVVSGPLAWTFVALYWNGAIAAHATGLAARILANVAIWSFLVYGLFFLVTYKVRQIIHACFSHTLTLHRITRWVLRSAF